MKILKGSNLNISTKKKLRIHKWISFPKHSKLSRAPSFCFVIDTSALGKLAHNSGGGIAFISFLFSLFFLVAFNAKNLYKREMFGEMLKQKKKKKFWKRKKMRSKRKRVTRVNWSYQEGGISMCRLWGWLGDAGLWGPIFMRGNSNSKTD